MTAAVVALKRLSAAKTRFRLPAGLRAELAWAMAVDTVQTLASVVDRVVLVTDEPSARSAPTLAQLRVEVLDESPGPPGHDRLNRALAAGLSQVAGVDVAVAALADLPALRAASVRRLVADAWHSGSPLIVPDADDVGTTMLAGTPTAMTPRFGGSSAQRHRRFGARDVADLDALSDARADVDDPAALRAAVALGVGTWTTRLVQRHPELLGS